MSVRREIQIDGDLVESDGEAEIVSVSFPRENEGPTERWQCRECGEEFDSLDDTEERCIGDYEGDTEGECEFPHDVDQVYQILDWVNSARIVMDEESDEISLCISLGDPRGAFVMRFRPIIDLKTCEKKIHMSVPHERMSSPHLPLKRVGDGMYEIG